MLGKSNFDNSNSLAELLRSQKSTLKVLSIKEINLSDETMAFILNVLKLNTFHYGEKMISMTLNCYQNLIENNSIRELKLSHCDVNRKNLKRLEKIIECCVGVEKLKLIGFDPDEDDRYPDYVFNLESCILYCISNNFPHLKCLNLENYMYRALPKASGNFECVETLIVGSIMSKMEIISMISMMMSCPKLKKLHIKYKPYQFFAITNELQIETNVLIQILSFSKNLEEIRCDIPLKFTNEFADTLIEYGKNLRYFSLECEPENVPTFTDIARKFHSTKIKCSIIELTYNNHI